MTSSARSRPDGVGYGRHHAGQSAADGIAAAIETSIHEQGWLPGHRIGTKLELGEQFGVAPATVSEALRLMRERGTIEVRPGPGGGAFVATVSPLIRLAQSVLALRHHGATVNDVLAVLDALDEAVVRDAVLHRSARDLRALDALMKKLAKAWREPSVSYDTNWALHRRIAEITPNAVLRTFYLNLVDYIGAEGAQATAEVSSLVPATAARLQVHHDIVETIRAQDVERIPEVMLRHRTG